MRAELKSLYSPDVDLETYYPDDPECFSLLLQAFIGLENEIGEDAFDFIVCTPQWLSVEKRDQIIFGTSYIIVTDYNIRNIENYLKNYIHRCVGDSWLEIASQLTKVGNWEFENYKSN